MGTLLPEQIVRVRPVTDGPMARLAAALLIDAVRCLAFPREHRLYKDALLYLLGPSRDEALSCEIACQLVGVTRDHLRRRLRSAGHWWDVNRPPDRIRIGHRKTA
jgi:hypothetical protein